MLPGVQLTIPAHPQHSHVLVRGCHMVGCPLCPHAGAGQVGASPPLHFLQCRHLMLLHIPQWRHLLLLHFPLWRHLLQLHFPQWRHHHPSWCSLGGPAASPGGSTSRTSGRSQHHQLHAPSQKPFSPPCLLGFLHALTGPPQSGRHASTAGALI